MHGDPLPAYHASEMVSSTVTMMHKLIDQFPNVVIPTNSGVILCYNLCCAICPAILAY